MSPCTRHILRLERYGRFMVKVTIQLYKNQCLKYFIFEQSAIVVMPNICLFYRKTFNVYFSEKTKFIPISVEFL